MYKRQVDGWDNLKAARNIYNNIKSGISKETVSTPTLSVSEKNNSSPFRNELKKISDWADGVEKKAAERSKNVQEQNKEEVLR